MIGVRCLCLAAVVHGSLCLLCYSAVGLEPIAITGQQAPGVEPGVRYSSFFDVSLARSGHVAFFGEVAGPGVVDSNADAGWYGSPGSISLLVRSGSQAPGLPAGTVFARSFYGAPLLSDNDRVVFNSNLAGPGIGSDTVVSVWSGSPLDPAHLQLVAQQGTQAAGFPAGVTYAVLTRSQISPTGAILFEGTAGGHSTVWAGTSDSPQVIALSNAPVPGDPNLEFGSLGAADVKMNASGQVVIQDSQTLWAGAKGDIRLVARYGDPFPGSGPAETYGYLGPTGPDINGAGQVAFTADINGTTSRLGYGVWAGNPAAPVLVARTGSHAPGTGANTVFWTLLGGQGPELNSAGQVLFGGIVSTPGAPLTSGIWMGAPDSLKLVALQGSQAEGLPLGYAYSGGFTRVLLGDAGEVAFTSGISGPDVTPGVNDYALWAGTPDTLHVIARTGDTIEVADGIWKTILSLSVLDQANESEGNGVVFDDFGRFVFEASFTDGSSGLFLASASVPEPLLSLPLLLTLSFLLRRRPPTHSLWRAHDG